MPSDCDDSSVAASEFSNFDSDVIDELLENRDQLNFTLAHIHSMTEVQVKQSGEYTAVLDIVKKLAHGTSVDTTVNRLRTLISTPGATSASEPSANGSSTDVVQQINGDSSMQKTEVSYRVIEVDLRNSWAAYPEQEKEDYKSFYKHLNGLNAELARNGPTEELIDGFGHMVTSLAEFEPSRAEAQLEAYTKRCAWHVGIKTYDHDTGLPDSTVPRNRKS